MMQTKKERKRERKKERKKTFSDDVNERKKESIGRYTCREDRLKGKRKWKREKELIR